MKCQRKVLGAAMIAALAAGPAVAEVTGVPGEALLVPLVMNSNQDLTNPDNSNTDFTNTYVAIRVPTTLGNDFVMNTYTAPNVTVPGTVVEPGEDVVFTIHWTYYDHESKNPLNGTCEVSPGDTVVWSTDTDLQAKQENDGNRFGGKCGSSLPERIGYLVIQTAAGADNEDADFALEATAYITDFSFGATLTDINDQGDRLLSVPVIPMADGEDPVTAAGTGTVDCDANLQVGQNEVINKGGVGDPISAVGLDNPCQVAPLAGGVRLNNGDGNLNTVHVAGGLQMGASDPDNTNTPGQTLHVMWFPRVDAAREAVGGLWDNDENFCSQTTPLPWEVNMWLYNSVAVTDDGKFTNFDDVTVFNAGTRADVIAALVYGVGTPQVNAFVCQPDNWLNTVMGYAQYIIPEEPDDDGQVTSAGVFFEAQDADAFQDAWTSHAMYARGFQF